MIKKFRFVGLVLLLIILEIGLFISRNTYYIKPIDEVLSSVQIETPDYENSNVKKLTYKSFVKNESKWPVDFRIKYIKDKNDNWYTYFDILPEEYVSEVFHLEPRQIKEFVSELTVETADERLITNSFSDLKVRFEVVD